ncbi:MAG: tetratricopeptide repeat protein [Muribaculaceae bacterium]|nr:tetratricopeptide repeat protein [Muribaculaceae bacterium]
MKKLYIVKIAVFVLLALSPTVLRAQMSDDDIRLRERINAAVMEVYDKALDKDPNDYFTRFSRANQLYLNGEYDRAIDDVKMVIAANTNKEKELRFDCYLLLAQLYDAKGSYQDEINSLKAAAEINPHSLACTDLLAKVSYKVGDYNAAERNFQIILRDSPMNYDALYGMAKVEVMRGNFEKAANYVDRAVSLFTAEPQVYINRSEVLNMMQQYEAAAQDLISALSVGNDSGKALNALFNMSDTQYDAVMNALASSCEKAPNVGMFFYVRAMIAMRHFHYGQALRDLKAIIAGNLYDYHSIYYYTGKCQMELCQWDDAIANLNKAIEMSSTEMDYYVAKAVAVRHSGRGNNIDEALEVLGQALAIEATAPSVLMAKARLLLDKRQDTQALECVSTVLTNYSNDAEALLLRGWINKYRLNLPDIAKTDFARVAEMGSDLHNLAGFAMHELGRDDQARQWAEQVIHDGVLPGGESYIYASALLSCIGNYDKGDKTHALDYLRSALANGYGSLYEIKVNENPYVNLKLARRYPDFETIISQNQDNFQERP